MAANYITYTVTVTNNGPSDVTSATLTSTLFTDPPLFRSCSYTTGSPCDPSTGNNWTGTAPVGSLGSGTTKTDRKRTRLNSSYRASSNGDTATERNQSPTDPTAGNNSDTANTSVTREADLEVHKSAPTNAIAGNRSEERRVGKDNSPSDGTSPTKNNTLSSELQSATFCYYTTGSPCTPSTGNNWTGTAPVGSLGSGTTKTFLIRAQIKPSTRRRTSNNGASITDVSPSDPTAGNNSDTANTSVTREADLEVHKSAPTNAIAGN